MAELPRVAVIGAGDRGSRYARLLRAHGLAHVVAVAEREPARRSRLADEVGVPQDGRFADWSDLLSRPRSADAVIVATRDTEHYAPTMAAIDSGYHVLVEKPMATVESECVAMVQAAHRAGVLLAACHVLRYAPYTHELRRIIDDGLIGDVVGVEHLEPVGWWHYAHSYVRGNWRREQDSTFMLMAKSVHDIDWIGHLVGRRARRVSSFGSLLHFRPDQAPLGAADRCVDCPVEPDCPYSAPRLYLSQVDDPDPNVWPLSVVTTDRTVAGVLRALREGPYGRCVYAGDNDVVDHQVVSIEYSGGVTASFTMMAFTPYQFRQTRVFGTHGSLTGNGRSIELTDFRNGNRTVVEVQPVPVSGAPSTNATAGDGGHGGGDEGLMRAFAASLADGRAERHLVPVEDSLASHRLTFAAERARVTGSVVTIDAADSAAAGPDRATAGQPAGRR